MAKKSGRLSAPRQHPQSNDHYRLIVAAIRKIWFWSRQRREALKLAKGYYDKYKCAKCKKEFIKTEVQVDHINPVIPLTGWDSWDMYISRLFIEAKVGLQVMCKSCHKEKSRSENAKRKEYKK